MVQNSKFYFGEWLSKCLFFAKILLPATVQDDLLAREIFGEFVSEIQLADFKLVILLWP